MPERIVRRILTFLAVVLVFATIVFAQSSTAVRTPINSASSTWQDAQSAGSSQHRLYVVTIDQPGRKQDCRVQSFTAEKLVCSRPLGDTRTFLPGQVAALIVPGDEWMRLPLFIGSNIGLGAAIWGTVVLAAACPVCAAATAVAALWFLGGAGWVSFVDGQPDRLLYLAPGQELSEKHGDLQH